MDALNMHQKGQHLTKMKQQAKLTSKTKCVAQIEETNSITCYFNQSQHDAKSSANAREESELPNTKHMSKLLSWADNGIVEQLLSGNTILGSLSSWD